MKRLISGLALGIALTAVSALPTFAQDDPCAAPYKTFVDNYRSKVDAEVDTAIAAGDELIQKCGSNADYAQQITFVNRALPGMKQRRAFGGSASRFNTALQSGNAPDSFAAGKELLALDSNLVDVMIALSALGYDKAVANPPVDTFNADTINYAKQSIQKIEGNAKTENYGALKYSFAKKNAAGALDPAASKDNTLSWLNYYIGYIMSERMKQKKEAIPYFYKSTQYNAGKTNASAFQMIGDFYKDEFNRLDDERTQAAAAFKTLTTDEEKKAAADKINELLAMQKGYADRMIEAYARAYNLAGSDKAYKDGLYNTLKALYGVRFDAKGTGLDAYIASMASKPLTDPSTPVTPVAAPVTTPVASTTTTQTTTTTTPVSTPPKPAATTKTTETKTVTTTPAATTKTETKTVTTTPAKKPEPKKKGTR